jgi:hypothetical protein
MNGRIAPQLQSDIVSRGLDIGGPKLLTWIGGLIDRESLEFLTLLNVTPNSINGLKASFPHTDLTRLLQVWYPKLKLEPKDIVNAFLYVSITEQLKRVDSLLRQTQIIQGAIENNTFGYHSQSLSLLGWQVSAAEAEIKAVAASLPPFSPTHPIVKASQDETERIGTLLSELITGNVATTARARTAILDMFRNALSDSWSDPLEARGQTDRSLIQRAFMVINEIVTNRTTKESYHRIDFTANLAYLNRVWTVTWTLGGQLLINSVKSRVLATSAAATNRYTNITSALSPVKMFAVPVRRRKEPTSIKPVPQNSPQGIEK